MGGTVLADAHRVMAPDKDRPGSAEGSQADGSSHVVAEHQEGPIDGEHPAVEGQAVADGPHGVLPDAEEQLASLGTVGALDTMAKDGGARVAGEVGSAAHQPWDDVEQSLDAGVSGLSGRHGRSGLPRREDVGPAGDAPTALSGVPRCTVTGELL